MPLLKPRRRAGHQAPFSGWQNDRRTEPAGRRYCIRGTASRRRRMPLSDPPARAYRAPRLRGGASGCGALPMLARQAASRDSPCSPTDRNGGRPAAGRRLASPRHRSSPAHEGPSRGLPSGRTRSDPSRSPATWMPVRRGRARCVEDVELRPAAVLRFAARHHRAAVAPVAKPPASFSYWETAGTGPLRTGSVSNGPDCAGRCQARTTRSHHAPSHRLRRSTGPGARSGLRSQAPPKPRSEAAPTRDASGCWTAW